MPPDDGHLFDIAIWECALKAVTSAAAMKDKGNHGPASSAICPVREKIPAPIITPVPIATALVSVIVPCAAGSGSVLWCVPTLNALPYAA